ncbi:MAG: hypothetical protein HYR84_07235 [Planctomycetes bacterium]|nr:hypothetical protein [Planctomycetota bacterium]
MSTTLMKGTVRNGRVETDEPINLPDGTELLITVSKNGSSDVEEAWDNSPEAIAAWLTWCDSLQPMKITAEEQADTAAWLKRQDEHEAAKRDKDIEDLFP